MKIKLQLLQFTFYIAIYNIENSKVLIGALRLFPNFITNKLLSDQ